MTSIKRRLVMNFMFIILITVIIMELFLITGIRNSYYKNLEDTLANQLQTSIALYERYFSDATLQENVLNNVDTFWKQVTAQVEIIDMEGRTIMNSLGVIDELSGGTADVQAALQGEKGVWVGGLHYATERVMAVAYPIRGA
ncbi:MAG TPA: hypothetical protein DCD97_04540 [Firmicutes bacterium]|nr:hypothetical protein [Bacillota bacterium]